MAFSSRRTAISPASCATARVETVSNAAMSATRLRIFETFVMGFFTVWTKMDMQRVDYGNYLATVVRTELGADTTSSSFSMATIL